MWTCAIIRAKPRCADATLTDHVGCTPLHLACRLSENNRVVSVLLGAGGNLHTADHRGRTALHYACQAAPPKQACPIRATESERALYTERSLRTAKLLVARGASLYLADDAKQSPMCALRSRGYTDKDL